MGNLFVRKALPYRRVEDYSILHLGSQKVFLNESGTQIWNLVDGHSSAQQIARTLASGYNLPEIVAERFTAKVEDFLDTLFLKGLLWKSEDGALKECQFAKSQSRADTIDDADDVQREEIVLHSVQEECMTLQSNKKAETLSEQIEKVYWDNHYIYKMHLELTYRCNFRCIHCYNPTHGGGRSELTTAEWERALDQLASMKCYLLTFTGGELFVRKDVVQILQMACDRGFTFRLNTNGSLIDEKMLEQLEQMRPFLQSFDISFYGAVPEVHDTLARRPGSYMDTLRAVKLLKEAKMSLVAKFVTMRDNFHGIGKFEDDMRKLGVASVVNSGSLIPRTDRSTGPLVQLTTDKQYEQLLATRGNPNGGEDPGSCKPGHIRGAITPDGFVSPCEWLTDYKLGNLRERTLAEIWYGSEFLSFRKIFEQESECAPCDLRSGCGRCPAHSYLETGSLLKCAPIQRHNAELYRDFSTAKA